MKKTLILLMMLVALLSGLSSRASARLDFATADALSYRYFQEKKWDSVIVIGKLALRQDIDYYYLRVRLGIAYFEKTDYFQAVTHLEKARQFNSGNPMVADYLYRAYIYTNRNEEANLISSGTSQEKYDTTHSAPGTIDWVHFETGYTISSDKAPKNPAILMGKDNIYGEQDLYGNSFYSNLGLKLRVSKRVGLTLAYNYLNFAKTKYIQYGRAEDHLQSITDTTWGKNYNYSFPSVIYDTSFSYHVSQHEAHFAATLTLPWGLNVTPVFHWIHVSYNMISPSFRRDTIQDTAFYTSIDNTYHTFSFPRTIYTFNRKDTSFNNFVAALGVTKELGIFNVGLHGSWSNLNGRTQKQASLSLTYYPLGNLNFYGTTTATGFFQGKDKRLLLSQALGAIITPWMWGEVNFYYGNYTNANIFDGSIVYNNSDIIDYRGGATLVFSVGKHVRLSLTYLYFRKESQQVYYIKTQDPVSAEINEIQQIKNNPYNTNTIIGGITWKL